MTRQLHSNEIRFDTLRGPGKNHRSHWRTDERGRLVWSEPTSINVVWLIANASLFLWIAWSMWGTNQILPFGGTSGIAFDSLYIGAPALTGLIFCFRAIQRAVARRSVLIDPQSAVCRVHTRTLTTTTKQEHDLNSIQIEIVSLNHVLPARGFIGVTRARRHHVVLVTPTDVFQVEHYEDFLGAQLAAESIAAQLGIAQGTGYSDGVVSTLRAYFRAPF